MRDYLWLCLFFVKFVTFINVKLHNLPCNLRKFYHYVILITLSNVLFYTLKPGTCVVRNGHHCVALRWLTAIRGLGAWHGGRDGPLHISTGCFDQHRHRHACVRDY